MNRISKNACFSFFEAIIFSRQGLRSVILKYGGAFADEPWLGRPDIPKSYVKGVLDNVDEDMLLNNWYTRDLYYISGADNGRVEVGFIKKSIRYSVEHCTNQKPRELKLCAETASLNPEKSVTVIL